jgi:predicted TIM-barrel fold metal-dependent hydrolase
VGQNDPDGFKQTPAELIAQLEAIGARGVTFPMHEPAGYGAANDFAIAAANQSRGVLWAFCRVDPLSPSTDPVAEAERCLDAGAAGIKLHPRAEGFTLGESAVERLFALAGERRVPILVHAGRGIPALGRDSVHLTEAHPEARLILAHGGISDLAWLHAAVEPGSNLFFDTAWWNPADLIALFSYVPSSQILWASDSPYAAPLTTFVWHMRAAVQAGLGQEALRSLAGGQSARILAGEEIATFEPPAGETAPIDPMLERVYTHLISAFGAANTGGDPAEKIDLARLSCAVPDEHPQAQLLHELERLIGETIAEYLPVVADGEHSFGDLQRELVSLLGLARTPAAGPAGD